MNTKTPPNNELSEFIFNGPLYEEIVANQNTKLMRKIHSYDKQAPLDSFCPYCHRESTFQFRGFLSPKSRVSHAEDKTALTSNVIDSVTATCARSPNHILTFVLKQSGGTIQKIGQYPSLADIANDEAKRYQKYLERSDYTEMHRAIGLAAHGVGVGSFVYLRRIFERLVYKKFDSHADAINVDASTFSSMRMDEKIRTVEAYLPEFVSKNARIYKILSRGIHELEEEECLKNFDVIKKSIFFIIEEDKRDAERREFEEELTRQVSSMELSPTPDQDG